jgi:hypothetical protein
VRVLWDVVPAARHDLLFAYRRDSRVGAVHGGRRRAGLGRFPAAHVPDVRVLGKQERQRGGSCARQADAEERRLQCDVVDRGVPPVPILDLQPLREVKPNAVVNESFAAGVQPRFLAQSPNQDLQALTEGVVTEVLKPRSLDCCRNQLAR